MLFTILMIINKRRGKREREVRERVKRIRREEGEERGRGERERK